MELKLKMIKKSLSKKISILLSVALLTATIYPVSTNAQNAFETDSTGQIENNNPFETDSTGQVQNQGNPFGVDDREFFENPGLVFDDQVSEIQGPSQGNVESCLASIVQDSLINTVTESLGESIGSLGLGDLFGEAMSGLGGTLSGVVSNTFGSLGESFGGQLGDALGDLGGSIDLGGISAGGFGSEVPVNSKASNELSDINNQLVEEVRQYEAARNAAETGDGATSLNSIAYCLANKAIEGILHGTIDWVNRGFDGNPAFVDNPEKFFGDIADYELGGLLDELSGGLLCSNIDASIRVNLIKDYNSQKYGGAYNNRRRCTLSDITENVEAFANGDFSQGGWDSWLEYTTNPYNNYYGATISVNQDLDERISRSQSVAALELDWNNGYQSIRDRQTGEITTPGNMIQSQVEKRLNAPIDRLTFADEFNELQNSLINQFVKMSIGEVFDDIF